MNATGRYSDEASLSLPPAANAALPATLLRVDFSAVDLTDSNLRAAELAGASLHDVRLTGATLEGADLTGVVAEFSLAG
jgi:uncharacterized protein YjbI with pentapeptide repeats